MTREEIMQLFDRRNRAWQRHDAGALSADYTEDAVAESPMLGRVLGRQRIGEVYANWMTAFPDLVYKCSDLIIDGNRVVEFISITGTQSGPFGNIPATGRKFHITGAQLYTLSDDGHITHIRRVYDLTNMLVQLGALRTKPQD